MTDAQRRVNPFLILSLMLHLGFVAVIYLLGLLDFSPRFEEMTEVPVSMISEEAFQEMFEEPTEAQEQETPSAPTPEPKPVEIPEVTPEPEPVTSILEPNMPDPVEPPALPDRSELVNPPLPEPKEQPDVEPEATPEPAEEIVAEAPMPKKKPVPPKPEAREPAPEPERDQKQPETAAAQPETVTEPETVQKPSLSDILLEMQKLRQQERPSTLKTYNYQSDTPVRSLGSSEGLSLEEERALRRQIEQCWNPPTGVKGLRDMSVQIRIDVNPDRTVQRSMVEHDLDRMRRDSAYRALAESANRAITNPRCSPLKLPPDKYEIWRSMILNFDPSKTF